MPPLTYSNLRGGRNNADSPVELPEQQCAEAVNVDWSQGPLGHKRGGSAYLDTTMAGIIGARSMFRHVPNGIESAAELWVVDSHGVVARLAAGVWTNPTLDDAITDNFQNVYAVTLNGKLFFAYNSAVDRLHVYDAVRNLIRRVGLAAPGVPSAANQGAGTMGATTRYYRTRVIDYNGTSLLRRSEPSPSVAWTPSGTGASVRVTLGTLPNEHETHWELEISLDNAVFYVLRGVENGNPIVIGTTTFDDTSQATQIFQLPTSEEVGLFTLPPSFEYLTTDGNRIIGGGSWEGGRTSRIFFTAVLGSSDHGDDERIIITDAIKGYVDINEKDGGRITGMSLPIEGIPHVFKYRQSWKLVPTGAADAPYIPRKVSDVVGCIHGKSIVMSEDAAGNPALGVLSPTGPYRVSVGAGVIALGRDIEDVWNGLLNPYRPTQEGNPVNLDASLIAAHGIYYTDLRQIWWWVVAGPYDSPNLKIVADTKQATVIDAFGVRRGWSIHDGLSAQAVCSVMFADEIGSTMSHRMKPYIGYRTPVPE
jgi:hypothetical protein